MLEIPAELGIGNSVKGGGEVGRRVVEGRGGADLQEGLMIYLDPGGTCASQTLMAAVTLPARTVHRIQKSKDKSTACREMYVWPLLGDISPVRLMNFRAQLHGKIPLRCDHSRGKVH